MICDTVLRQNNEQPPPINLNNNLDTPPILINLDHPLFWHDMV